MPSNIVIINNSKKLEWHVSDSKIDEVIELLDEVDIQESKEKKSKMAKKGLFAKIYHYLFKCPTFWHYSKWIICPDCGGRTVCYWDGNDCKCGTIDLCNKCGKKHLKTCGI